MTPPVLAVTGEFRTGMVLASFASVPRRGRLLLAKTVVVAVWCVLLSSALALFCWFAAGRLTYVEGGIPLTDPGVVCQLWVQVAAATLTGVLALGVGALLRSWAGALGVSFGSRRPGSWGCWCSVPGGWRPGSSGRSCWLTGTSDPRWRGGSPTRSGRWPPVAGRG